MTFVILNEKEVFEKYLALNKKTLSDFDTDSVYANLSIYTQFPNINNLFTLIYSDIRVDTFERDLLLTNIFALIILNESDNSIIFDDKIQVIKSNELEKDDVFVWCNELSACIEKINDSGIRVADIFNGFKLGEEAFLNHQEVDQQPVFKIGSLKI